MVRVKTTRKHGYGRWVGLKKICTNICNVKPTYSLMRAGLVDVEDNLFGHFWNIRVLPTSSQFGKKKLFPPFLFTKLSKKGKSIWKFTWVVWII